MTYRQALTYRRPWWRTAGRVVIDLGHALVLAAVMVLPGALLDLYHQGKGASNGPLRGIIAEQGVSK